MFFLFCQTFLFLKNVGKNRRVSKRKNGNEIIQFNNIIHFKYYIQQTFFGFLNVDEKEKAAKFCCVVRCSSVKP